MRNALFFLVFPLCFAVSCSGLTPRGEIGDRQITVASWYGEYFHGRKTASGEVYDMYGFTAAHRSLPFGTRLKVTHRENGKTVHVIVNDRGPFVRGRSLDLSYGAAKALGMVRSGVASVEIEVVGRIPAPKAFKQTVSRFSVQVGSYRIPDRAERVKEKLSHLYRPIHIVPHRSEDRTYYQVRVGSFGSEREAEKIAKEIRSNHGLEALVVRGDI